MTMMTSQRALWTMWHKIQEQNIEYFADTTIMMWVAMDTVNADILVNNGGISISCAPHDTTFCKPLYKFSDTFALNSEYLNDF